MSYHRFRDALLDLICWIVFYAIVLLTLVVAAPHEFASTLHDFVVSAVGLAAIIWIIKHAWQNWPE